MALKTSFRGKLLLLALLPLALAQLVTLYGVMRTVERDVFDRARESLSIGATIVDEYLAGRGEQLRVSVTVLAADFGLKEAVATGDARTIRSVLENHSRRVDAELALLLDLDGRLLASTDAGIPGTVTALDELIADEDSRSTVQSTAVIGGNVYQAFAVPLRAPTPIAWVVLGFRLGDPVVERIEALTGLDVALTADTGGAGMLAASGTLHDIGDPQLAPGPNPPGGVDDGVAGNVWVIGEADSGLLAAATPFVRGTTNHAGARVVLLRSIAEAMAPYSEARRALVAFGVVLLGIVALAAVWLSGSIARPLSTLTSAARRMATGDYDVDVAVESTDEIGELASSFAAMRTAIAEREERISHQALHDPLTDLPNHASLVQRLDAALREAAAAGEPVCILSLRLARMNAISSTLGHSARDDLVRLAARHLRLNLEADEILGHTGAEEFVVLMPGNGIDGGLQCAEKLAEVLNAGVTLGRAGFSLQSCIGIAAFPDHGDGPAELLRNASIARSEAEHDKEQVAVFQRGREDDYVRRLRIVNDLRAAFHRGEIQVWYQPKVSLPAGTACGAEALVRWQHAEYGWLRPDEFIPAAEEAGTIVHLTRYVMRDAIARCREWRQQGHELQVSVNISVRDLCDDYLPYYVLQLLKENGIPARDLTLEVTENSVMQQLRRSMTVLECLRDIGVRVSMDDFGTGQSSLAQLRNMPLDEVKIDKSFVLNLAESPADEAIVKTTLDLAHNLGLDVVAEGVENEETLRLLSGAGCEQAQGYYLSRPVSPAEFLKWLGNYRPRSWEERRGSRRAFRKGA